MCGDDDDVCCAAYDGRPSKYGWSQGRGGRKWQRWWRRSMRRRWAMRRMHAHIHRYYHGDRGHDYDGIVWQVRWLIDNEIRHHLFTVRMGGEGRFGKQWPRWQDWSWNNQTIAEVPWREANGEGPGLHIWAVGKFAKHAVYTADHTHCDYCENKRYFKDPYYRWDQHQLRRLGDDE